MWSYIECHFYYNKEICSYRIGKKEEFRKAILNGYYLSQYQNNEDYFLDVLKGDIVKYHIDQESLKPLPFYQALANSPMQ